ncbi:MAG: flagellar motor protein MotB [Pseudobdellovibrionaceae bacterium]
MAKEKPMIVIKKVIVVGAGHHGGSWKVALADFMTAMMAFFLVMWLLGQSDDTKKAISDYFSTPSVIEYNFQNFGVEITLEKLFMDLMNEPLKAIQSFMEPADKTPNILDFNSSKVISAFVMDQLQEYIENMEVTSDGFSFEIPDRFLFEQGTSKPKPTFIPIMEKLSTITTGLEDSDLKVMAVMLVSQVPDMQPRTAVKVASTRTDLIKAKVKASLESNSVSVAGAVDVKNPKNSFERENPQGFVRITVTQKQVKSNGQKAKPIEGAKDSFSSSVIDSRVGDEAGVAQPTGQVKETTFKNPLDEEFGNKNLADDEMKE